MRNRAEGSSAPASTCTTATGNGDGPKRSQRGVARNPRPKSEPCRQWLSSWRDWHTEAEECIPSGEFVVVLTRYTGRGKESGVDVDVQGAHVWQMRAGRAVRLEIFSS